MWLQGATQGEGAGCAGRVCRLQHMIRGRARPPHLHPVQHPAAMRHTPCITMHHVPQRGHKPCPHAWGVPAGCGHRVCQAGEKPAWGHVGSAHWLQHVAVGWGAPPHDHSPCGTQAGAPQEQLCCTRSRGWGVGRDAPRLKLAVVPHRGYVAAGCHVTSGCGSVNRLQHTAVGRSESPAPHAAACSHTPYPSYTPKPHPRAVPHATQLAGAPPLPFRYVPCPPMCLTPYPRAAPCVTQLQMADPGCYPHHTLWPCITPCSRPHGTPASMPYHPSA